MATLIVHCILKRFHFLKINLSIFTIVCDNYSSLFAKAYETRSDFLSRDGIVTQRRKYFLVLLIGITTVGEEDAPRAENSN